MYMQSENSNLGSKVRDSRKKLGLSQEALAEKANVSLSTIQRIEKGNVKPRPFTTKILAETLGLDLSELISNQNENFTNSLISLKRINLAALIFAFIPFISLIIPTFLWKKDKQIQSENSIVGKIISFQLLWSIITIVGMGMAIFMSNLIFGQAGNGLYFSLIFYFLAILFNVFIIFKTSSQLNQKDENILLFVPNLF